jgi:hypothetical protein
VAQRSSLPEARVVFSLGVLVAAGVAASVGCVTIDDRTTVQAGESGQGTSSGGKGGNGGSSAKGGSGGSGATGGSTTGGSTNGGSSGKGGSTTGGSGGTGGSGATGGSTNGGSTNGGSSGKGGSATGGSSGSGGGTGGTGGSGGSGGGSVSCGDDVTPTAARVRTCVYAMSCNPLVPFTTLSSCLTYGLYLDCNEGATSCAEVEACSGVAREPDSACESGEMGWKCEGDVAVRCEAPFYSIDCARLGGKCDLFESTAVEEFRFPCKLASPSSCSPEDPSSYTCSGSSTSSCVDGKPYGMDCTAWGGDCVESVPGEAGCSTTTADCDDPGGSTCVDNVLHYCDSDGRLGIYDCGPSGSTCLADPIDGGYCLAPGCTTDYTCTESCVDGTHLEACVGGAPYQIDCTAYGFKSCITYKDHPVTMGDYVECSMQELDAAL